MLRVRRGVYATADACHRAREAARHGGPLACVSAARHLGLWTLEPESEVHVWMGGGGHRHPHPSCVCVEHWDDAIRAKAFAHPSLPRVLRQILGCRGVESFFVAVESALRHGRLTESALVWLRGNTNDAGREAIEFARPDSDSGLESLLRWRLRRHGLTVQTQVAVDGVGRIDFLIGDRLLVEVDGRANHEETTVQPDGTSLRHKDLVRDASAAAWDYATLRFDYALVVHDWDLVERAILAQVAARRHLR